MRSFITFPDHREEGGTPNILSSPHSWQTCRADLGGVGVKRLSVSQEKNLVVSRVWTRHGLTQWKLDRLVPCVPYFAGALMTTDPQYCGDIRVSRRELPDLGKRCV